MKKFAFLSFLIILFLSSCQKNSIPLTQGQLTALRLEKDLGVAQDETSSIYSIKVFNQSNSSVISLNWTSLKITSDGFIELSGTNLVTTKYNLDQVKSYSILPTNNLFIYL